MAPTPARSPVITSSIEAGFHSVAQKPASLRIQHCGGHCVVASVRLHLPDRRPIAFAETAGIAVSGRNESPELSDNFASMTMTRPSAAQTSGRSLIASRHPGENVGVMQRTDVPEARVLATGQAPSHPRDGDDRGDRSGSVTRSIIEPEPNS